MHQFTPIKVLNTYYATALYLTHPQLFALLKAKNVSMH